MSITAANAVITISVVGVFPTPIQLQQFSAQNVYNSPALEAVETQMGVDGVLTGGKVNNPVDQVFELMGDSPSNDLFEEWAAQQKLLGDTITGDGVTNLVALGKSYIMTKGFLVSVPALPNLARTIQPRQWTVRWQSVDPQAD